MPPTFPRSRPTGGLAALTRLTALVIAGAVSTACGTGTEDTAQPRPNDDHLVGHVHGLGVDPADDTLYVAGHHGVFRVEDGTPARVADRWQDTMAFTIAGPRTFLASGHPDLQEDLPSHLGLIESTDAGETWRALSLQGEADFHALEVVGERIYGWDSIGGRLMTTTDGTSWQTLTKMPIVDLAAVPSRPETVVGTTPQGSLVQIGTDGSSRTVRGAPAVGWIDSPTDGTLVGLGAGGEVFTSSGPDEEWQAVGRVPGAPAALETTADAWYAATDEAIYRSGDDGETWEPLAGLTSAH